MLKAPDNLLPLLLVEQQSKAWQHFTEQHPNMALTIPEQVLGDFKLFITLSDFALRSLLQEPNKFIALFTSGDIYGLSPSDYLPMVNNELNNCHSEAELHQQLRLFRLQQMVKIAFADLVLNIALEQSLRDLSNLADALILAARDWLSDYCYQKWGTPVNQAGSASRC